MRSVQIGRGRSCINNKNKIIISKENIISSSTRVKVAMGETVNKSEVHAN